jgi:hypothetical protein
MSFYPTKGHKEVAATPIVDANTPGITGREELTILDPDKELANRKYVINTQNNATGINTDRSFQVVADMKGYAEGSAITVTYYKEHYSETDVRGKYDDTDDGVHDVHKSVLKIHNFELRMTGSLQYEHDTAETKSKLSGEALTYPGFRPEKGDKFVMEVDTGKCALMQVTDHPSRLSIRASTYYKIQFAMVEWVSNDVIETLEQGITDEAWFDKTRFLNEPGALLYHDEYVELKYLKKQRLRMIKYHTAKFLDKNLMFSYMRPDNIYDPYIVDFLLRTLEHTEAGYRPVQLFRGAPFIDVSVWVALLDENLPLETVPTSTMSQIHILGSKSVKHNALTNKMYLYWIKSMNLKDWFDQVNDDGSGDDTTEGEIPADSSIPTIPAGDESDDKIVGDLLLHLHPHYRECMGDEEEDGSSSGLGGTLDLILLGSVAHVKLMRLFLLTRKIDLKLLHTCIEEVWSLPLLEQFYKMPIYEFLADKAQMYIQHLEGLDWQR